MDKKFLSTTEVALLLGISRQAVFKKIKAGQLPARKIGRNFVIYNKELSEIISGKLTNKMKKEIEKAVEKTINEYSETLRLLGQD
ncbi:MAG: hypothetical protein CO078_00310 [Candidatus Nealsonbacteria bacterium CG_4_9_14_0_8_um_filter_36_17]|uniref:Helix-turn-helix domain-containing protein n=1 Tax=Candidatus Nealsonbacteria bacterium CG_4_9_14_0_8_um_filter_36_17 TaxID=1974693 RepID=A0A2M8DM05_9BACT|nr:MAG: hypothetical protein CO078_00310 [Candidatus Nealsonbacteria bacterium CG_4_9_14_0_8_um_filter_36_17]